VVPPGVCPGKIAARVSSLRQAGQPDYTIAAELGDINRFPTLRKLAGFSGLCPRVYRPRARPARPARQANPRYLRWALVEAATHACTHPTYMQRYQDTKARIASNEAPRSRRSTSPAGSPKRSGTCSPAINPSLPQAPPTPWPPDGPEGAALPERTPIGLVLPLDEAIER
jgi:Transposase IS116/IS110/IS902 family